MTTPIYWSDLAPIARDLVTPGRAKARWHASVDTLWCETTRQHGPGASDGPETLEARVPAAEIRRSVQEEALARLRRGPAAAEAFNAWRRGQGMRPLLLAGADLRERDLQGFDLSRCILYDADLRGADLRGCQLTGAVLKGARIGGAQLGPDTLAGHDLDELADAIEGDAFQSWIRSVERRDLSHLISVTEVSRRREGRKALVWKVKLHNNVRQTLRTKVWLENGTHAELAVEQVLEPRRSHVVGLKVAREKFPKDRPLTLTVYVEGVAAPVKRHNAWGWEREWL